MQSGGQGYRLAADNESIVVSSEDASLPETLQDSTGSCCGCAKLERFELQ